MVLVKFQSHYGAIATRVEAWSTLGAFLFQSHYGAIATLSRQSQREHCFRVSIPLWCDCDNRLVGVSVASLAGFNPTMVRLRPEMEREADSIHRRFNPTMVRLRRSHLARRQLFQSHYGAIATCAPQGCSWHWRWVSIPLWCDCDL